MNEMNYIHQSAQIKFLFKLYAFSYIVVWLLLVAFPFHYGNFLLSLFNLLLFSIYILCHFLPEHIRIFKFVRMLPHALFSFTVYFESGYFNTNLLLSIYLLHVLSLGFLYKIDYDKILIIFFLFFDFTLMLLVFFTNSGAEYLPKTDMSAFFPSVYELLGVVSAVILIVTINSYYQSLLSYRCNELQQFVSHEAEVPMGKPLSKGVTAGMSVRLMQLAHTDLSSFYEEFNVIFPDFETQIRLLAPNITVSEMELIKLIKMNLTTKDIALLTNSTLKTIESKKYRIRKKLNISSNAYMNVYFNTQNF